MADKEAAPTTSEAVVVCLHPDFCRRGDSVVAYDILARESDDVEHSADVRITGCWASHEGARLKTVYQDSPGDAGVKSGCVEGYARPVRDTSPTVLVNGQGCVRHDTEFEMNCDGPDGPHNTTGKMVYGQGTSSNVCGPDGMPTGDCAPPVELTDAEKAALQASGVDPSKLPKGGFWSELKGELGNQWESFKDKVGLNGSEAFRDHWLAAGEAAQRDLVLYGPPGLMNSDPLKSPFAFTPEWEQALADNAADADAAIDAYRGAHARGGWNGVAGLAVGQVGPGVVAGVVGKQAGALAKQGVNGVRVRRKKRTPEEIRKQLEDDGWELIEDDQQGVQHDTYKKDDEYAKMPIRSEDPKGRTTDPGAVAELEHQHIEALRRDPALRPHIVETELHDGYITQGTSPGVPFDQLSPEWHDLAQREVNRLGEAAASSSGLSSSAAKGLFDNNPGNFTFTLTDGGGLHAHWFDPIDISAAQRLRLGGDP